MLSASPLLVLAAWSLLHLGFWPWPESMQSWLRDNDPEVYQGCMLTFMVLLYPTMLLMPVLMCLCPLVIWKRSTPSLELHTSTWLWGALLAPFIVPAGWLLVAILY